MKDSSPGLGLASKALASAHFCCTAISLARRASRLAVPLGAGGAKVKSAMALVAASLMIAMGIGVVAVSSPTCYEYQLSRSDCSFYSLLALVVQQVVKATEAAS